jgi:hypothetical protein
MHTSLCANVCSISIEHVALMYHNFSLSLFFIYRRRIHTIFYTVGTCLGQGVPHTLHSNPLCVFIWAVERVYFGGWTSWLISQLLKPGSPYCPVSLSIGSDVLTSGTHEDAGHAGPSTVPRHKILSHKKWAVTKETTFLKNRGGIWGFPPASPTGGPGGHSLWHLHVPGNSRSPSEAVFINTMSKLGLSRNAIWWKLYYSSIQRC